MSLVDARGRSFLLIALVAGVMAAVTIMVHDPYLLGPLVSAQALIMTLFGGVGTLWGAVIGAVVRIPLAETLRASLGHILPGIQGVIYGLVIIVVIVVAPEGLYWRVRDHMVKRRPAPNLAPARQAQVPALTTPRVQPRGKGADLLQVSGLSKMFGGPQALKDVSFTVRSGTIVGIIGPNGAGKTTLFNLLNGFYGYSAGDVLLGGKTLKGLRPNEICRLGVGRTFQVTRPFARMTVLDNVVVGTLASTHDRGSALARAHAALERVDLAPKAGFGVKNLTNLELRLMELARALAARTSRNSRNGSRRAAASRG